MSIDLTVRRALAPGPGGGLPFATHVVETVRLALPIILARSAIVIMFTVDTLMAGWAGSIELAYIGLGVAPYLVLMLVAIGALQAVMVLTAQAVGAGTLERTGAVLRAGLVHACLFGIVITLASVPAEAFFRLTGQDPGVAAGAAGVSQAFAWGVWGMLLFVAINVFLEATGRPRVGMWAMILANLVNVPLNGIFALGWGGFFDPGGAFAAVAASSALRWAAFVAVLVFLVIDQLRHGDPQGFFTDARGWMREAVALGGRNGKAIRGLGLPMGLAQGVESAAFATVVFIAGRLGAAELAAYQMTMTLVTLVFMAAIGTAGATAIRVGKAFGAGDGGNLRAAGFAGVAFGFVLPVPIAIAFMAAPVGIASIFTDDPAVLALAATTFVIAGPFLLIDGAMGVVMGALRGLGDVWIPTLLQAGAFWCVAVPAAWLVSGPLGFGAAGLLLGVVAGVCASLALLIPRFWVVSGRY